MNDKKMERIEKLLRLSMSDNPHEAKLALERAVKLMNENNVTEDEVLGQGFVSEEFTLEYKRLPDWASTLYTQISYASSCVFSWKTPKKYYFVNDKLRSKGTGVLGRVTGRKRDVENALYLADFIMGRVKKASKEYLEELKRRRHSVRLKEKTNAYKIGMVESISDKLIEEQRVFFSTPKTGKDIVCMDFESKYNDAKSFFDGMFDTPNIVHDTDKSLGFGYKDGVTAGAKIRLNPAVNNGYDVLALGRGA